MPHDAGLPIPRLAGAGCRDAHPARPHRLFHRRVHGVELVVAGDDLMQPVTIRVFLEHNEVLDEVEETPRVEDAADERIEFQDGLARFILAVNRPPDFEPFLTRRQRPHPRMQAVRDHQHLVVVEEATDLLFMRFGAVGRPSRWWHFRRWRS